MPFKKGQVSNPKGRKKGVPNKKNKILRDMILGALDKAGGEKYLEERAKDNPTAFLTLIGKVLPTQITGGDEDDKPMSVTVTFER